MKIFVDTNIFLDLILKRDFFREALLIFNAIEKKVFLGAILDITLLNIDYISKKQVKDIRDFLKLVNKNFTVIGASNDMIREALDIENEDLEDTLQYLGAKELQCDCIVTNDKSFYKSEIKILSSHEFVQEFLR